MTKSEAIEYIRGQLALNDTPSTWSDEDKYRYRKALAEFEQANPGIFPDSIASVVDRVAAKPYDPLVDDSFSFSDFGGEVLNNAKEASFSLFGSLRTTLYLVAVVGVVAYLWFRFGKK